MPELQILHQTWHEAAETRTNSPIPGSSCTTVDRRTDDISVPRRRCHSEECSYDPGCIDEAEGARGRLVFPSYMSMTILATGAVKRKN